MSPNKMLKRTRGNFRAGKAGLAQWPRRLTQTLGARTGRYWCQQFSERGLIGSSGIAMNRANHHMCMWIATTVPPSSGWSRLPLREIWVSRRTNSGKSGVL